MLSSGQEFKSPLGHPYRGIYPGHRDPSRTRPVRVGRARPVKRHSTAQLHPMAVPGTGAEDPASGTERFAQPSPVAAIPSRCAPDRGGVGAARATDGKPPEHPRRAPSVPANGASDQPPRIPILGFESG